MINEQTPIYILTEYKHVPPSPIGYFTIKQLEEYVRGNYPVDNNSVTNWISDVTALNDSEREETIYIRADWTLGAVRVTKDRKPKLFPIIHSILTTDPCPAHDKQIPSWVVSELSHSFSTSGDDAHHMRTIADRILIHFDTIDNEKAIGKLYMMVGNRVLSFSYTQTKGDKKAVWNAQTTIDVNERGIITGLADITECVRILNDLEIEGLSLSINARLF